MNGKSGIVNYQNFINTCQRGLSTIRPLLPDAKPDPYGWQFGSGLAPSYWAFGRMRALLTLEKAAALKPQRFLEIAAGDGALSACLAQGDCEAVANDLQADQLARALDDYQTKDRVRVIGGNLFDLNPDELGQFDLIAACEVIEHVAHPDEMLAHLKKLLAPNGKIILTTPNGKFLRNTLPTYRQVKDFTALEAAQFKPDADGHLFLFTRRELEDLCRASGFVIEQSFEWATPLLTGHFFLRYLASKWLIPAAYWSEVVAQWLPLREYFTFNLFMILGHGE